MQGWAGDPQYAPWNQHTRCECHECTQARYRMSGMYFQGQDSLGGATSSIAQNTHREQ